MARSRRLGSVGEVSVWPDPATRETDFGGQKFARIFSQEFCSSQEFSSQEFGRVQLLIGKTIIGRFSNRKLCARANLFGRDAARVFCTQRLQIREDWVLSTQSSPAVCAFGGWSRPEDGRVRGIFLARIWVGATRRGFSLHRDRGFVEIGFYLHRDCRCIGPCGAIIFSPRFARTRRVYVYVYTI